MRPSIGTRVYHKVKKGKLGPPSWTRGYHKVEKGNLGPPSWTGEIIWSRRVT